MISKTLRVCPGCLDVDSVRIILYGLPVGPPNPEIYLIGGCCVSENDPDIECISCGWQGSKKQVKLKTKQTPAAITIFESLEN